MANITFASTVPELGNLTHIAHQQDVEFVADVAELFLSFLRGMGYTYINQVVLVKDNGEEVATLR